MFQERKKLRGEGQGFHPVTGHRGEGSPQFVSTKVNCDKLQTGLLSDIFREQIAMAGVCAIGLSDSDRRTQGEVVHFQG